MNAPTPRPKTLPRPKRARPAAPLVSLVAPVFNESEALPTFLDAMIPALTATGERFEIVFVNDGSRDDTLGVLLAAAAMDSRLRIVNLARNFGKEAALTAGIDHAKGDAIIVIDVDLQDPPELIADFLAQWREGYDVVYGVRVARDFDAFWKRFTAHGFYGVFNVIAETPIPPNAGDFRLIDRRVADALQKMPERNRFMKGLFAWVGFSSIGVPYERRERAAGLTKFRFGKLWNFALDGIASFSTMPLKVWTYIGIAVAVVAIWLAAYIIVRTMVYGVETPGYASLMVAILLAAAVQLISIGVLGEYVGRIFLESKARPIYIVDDVYGGEEEEQPPQRSEQS
ncbi:MAG: glycosyltransferase family 2 protein [Hyphomonadaceae bacterium]